MDFRKILIITSLITIDTCAYAQVSMVIEDAEVDKDIIYVDLVIENKSSSKIDIPIRIKSLGYFQYLQALDLEDLPGDSLESLFSENGYVGFIIYSENKSNPDTLGLDEVFPVDDLVFPPPKSRNGFFARAGRAIKELFAKQNISISAGSMKRISSKVFLTGIDMYQGKYSLEFIYYNKHEKELVYSNKVYFSI